MNLGLLDLPAPLFQALDDVFAFLHVPGVLRVVAYATVCAWLGMRLYGRFSDQPRLTELRGEVVRSQRALALHDGDFAALRPLIRQNLRLSLRQLGLTLRPALLASLPLLFVLPWLSNRFQFDAPVSGAAVSVCAQPAAAATSLHWQSAIMHAAGEPGCWILNWPDADTQATLVNANGESLFAFKKDIQSNFVHKFIWLNWLIGNPNGYLAAAAPLDRLVLALPAHEMVGIGPAWVRGWELWFFCALLLVSLTLKMRWRLQ
jgi:hypothetical protein